MKDYEALKADIERRHQAETEPLRQKLADADARKAEALQALAVLFDYLPEANGSITTSSPRQFPPPPTRRPVPLDQPSLLLPHAPMANGGIGIVEATRIAVQKMANSFTKTEVIEWLAANYPELNARERWITVATVVARMNGTVLVPTGKRGKETLYSRKADIEGKSEAAISA